MGRTSFCKKFLVAGLAGLSAFAVAGQQSTQEGFRPGALAPQQQQPASTASVNGHVYCSDTQRPARFAQVMLIPVEEATGNDGRGANFGRRGMGRTDLQGAFTITNVQPGDYYVNASATGYVSEASLMMAGGLDQASAMAHMPTVHVAANAPSTVNVSMDRGAVIAGRVQWDDGTPAAGVQVSLQSATPAQPGRQRGMIFGFGGMYGGFGQTDDRGQFRLSGIAPGTYYAMTVVEAAAPGGESNRLSAITMYAPGKIRRADAQTVTVHAGEERNDITMTVDLSALHHVAGRVGAVSGTVASGSVRLVDTQDNTLNRNAQIQPDGTYSLNYVPAGTYTLSVPFASSNVPQQGRGGGRGGGFERPSNASFQPFQETVSVTDTDLSGVNITLTPKAATQSAQ